MTDSLEPLSDHPLFRALVLMGGGLALSCGGAYSSESGGGANPALVNAGGTSSNPSGAGGSAAGASPLPTPECPFAQWDCSRAEPVCVRDITNLTLPPGCVCDGTRPLSANDCKPDQSLLCKQGFVADRAEATWD